MPGDCMQAVKMLARLHHQMGSPERAAQVLEQQVQTFPEATDLTHINILAELFMDAGQHEQAASLIRQAEHLPCMQHGVPIDLRVSPLVVSHLWRSRMCFHGERSGHALPKPCIALCCLTCCIHTCPP